MIQLATIRRMIKVRLPRGATSRRAWLAGAILGGSVLISASIFATGPSPAPQIKTEKAWPVSVLTVAPADLAPSFATYGRVESTQIAHVQSDLGAEITAVPVREGQWVDKDDVLVELDRRAFELRVKEREAELAQQQAALTSLQAEQRMVKSTDEQFRAVYDVAQKKRTRHEDLFKRRMIAQSLLDEVVQQASAATIEYQNHRRVLADFPNRIAEQLARIDGSEAALAQSRIDLDHTTLRAPFYGPVLAVTASAGNHTMTGTTLVEVADANGFEIRAPIPDGYGERLRRALSDGQDIRARLADDGRQISLGRLASNVRPGQSGLDAFFRLELGAGSALPDIGRVVDLEVTLPPESAVVALPVQSIYENDRVYAVADDNRLQAITVQRVGEQRTVDGAHRVLVRSNELTAGSRIITTQLPKAISGLRVEPISS